MKKPALPSVPGHGVRRWEFDARIKEMLEILIGRKGNKIAKLPEGASQADMIEKINELIDHFM